MGERIGVTDEEWAIPARANGREWAISSGAGREPGPNAGACKQDDWGLTASHPIQCQGETRASRQVVLIELAADVVAEISGEH